MQLLDRDGFGRGRRSYGSGNDALLAVAFLLTLALGLGVGVYVLGSAWTLPETTGISPVETRRSALFGNTGPEQLTGPPTETPTTAPAVADDSSPVPPPATIPVFVVSNTGSEGGTWLMRAPTENDNDRIFLWPNGTQLVPVGPDAQVFGQIWHNVRDPLGNVGFVLAQHTQFVEAATPQPAPTPTPTPQPSVTATPPPQPSPSITVTPQATPSGTPSPPAGAYVVGNTGGDGGAWLRASPRLDDRLRILVDGTRVETAGPDVQAEGRLWRHVRDPQGNVGYIPAEWLIPVP